MQTQALSAYLSKYVLNNKRFIITSHKIKYQKSKKVSNYENNGPLLKN